MKKSNKKILTVIICTIIMFNFCGILNKYSYAENKTNNNTTNSSNSTKSNTSSSNKTTNSSSTNSSNKKSSNANLSNLGIRPNDFSGFKAGTTSYDVTVPADTDTIEIYATAQDSNAKISGTGSKKLEAGKNTFSVVVTAEDGTKKTYTINITKSEGKGENTESVQEQYSGDGLASLKIEKLELSPKFDTTVHEYTVKYIGEKDKLDINVTTTDPYYTTEITGNEDLKEGESIINILVSDPDGKNVATYQITVNKSLVDENALADEKQKEEQKNQKIIIGSIIGIVVILIIIIVIVVKRRRNRQWEEEYTVPFSGINESKEEENSIDEIEENEDIGFTKEQAREKFLSNYNKNYDEDELESYEEMEEPTKKKKHKGKRFK